MTLLTRVAPFPHLHPSTRRSHDDPGGSIVLAGACVYWLSTYEGFG